jgi:hypothetical protein
MTTLIELYKCAWNTVDTYTRQLPNYTPLLGDRSVHSPYSDLHCSQRAASTLVLKCYVNLGGILSFRFQNLYRKLGDKNYRSDF